MTSTGFHVAWVADPTLRPTFQLNLVSARSSTVRLRTQKASLMVSGLEPGVLYLVEIVARACGQESAKAQLKVRTGNRLWKQCHHGVLKGRRKSRKEVFNG